MDMASAATPDRPTKLPLWRAIVWCYAKVLSNLGFLFRISWLWLMLMVPLLVAADRYIEDAKLDGAISDSMSIALSLLSSCLLMVPFVSSIAYAWIRFLLLGERRTGIAYLRLDWPVLRLMPVSLLGSLYWLAYAVVSQLPWNWLGFWLEAAFHRGMPVLVLTFVIAMGLLLIVPVVVSFRLVTALPAMVFGQGAGVLARSLQQTRNNFWRIFLGTIVVVAVPDIVQIYPGILNDSDAPTSLVASAITALADLISVWFWLAFAAFCAEHFGISAQKPGISGQVSPLSQTPVPAGGE
jgi:hypothetical protein